MKNEKEYLKLDTFSILANVGWVLTLLKACGVTTQLPWHAILGYWLVLLGTSTVLYIVTALAVLWAKGGDKGGGHSAK